MTRRAHVHSVYREVLHSVGESSNYLLSNARRFNMADSEAIRCGHGAPVAVIFLQGIHAV